jgi:hypothetical protein
VQRAKDYAFGNGVPEYQWFPEQRMADAWENLAAGQGTSTDELLLNHELLESDLVVNQGMSTKEARDIANEQYNWAGQL